MQKAAALLRDFEFTSLDEFRSFNREVLTLAWQELARCNSSEQPSDLPDVMAGLGRFCDEIDTVEMKIRVGMVHAFISQHPQTSLRVLSEEILATVAAFGGNLKELTRHLNRLCGIHPLSGLPWRSEWVEHITHCTRQARAAATPYRTLAMGACESLQSLAVAVARAGPTRPAEARPGEKIEERVGAECPAVKESRFADGSAHGACRHQLVVAL